MSLIVNENLCFTCTSTNADGISFLYYTYSSAVGLTNVNDTLTFLRLCVIVVICMCFCVPM